MSVPCIAIMIQGNEGLIGEDGRNGPLETCCKLLSNAVTSKRYALLLKMTWLPNSELDVQLVTRYPIYENCGKRSGSSCRLPTRRFTTSSPSNMVCGGDDSQK